MKKIVTITSTVDGKTQRRTWVRDLTDAAINLKGRGAATRDLGARMTDGQYAVIQRRLKDIYTESARGIRAKTLQFARAHESRVLKYKKQLEAGEINQADFDAWMRGQLFQGRAWEQRAAQIAEAMTRADEQAMALVNRGKLGVFIDNANYIGYTAERHAGARLGFGLYDQETVARLIRDDPALLPMGKIDPAKNYAWYNRKMGDIVTQGILQGEDLDGMMMRMALDLNESSLSTLQRNVRTAYTSAQNAGREAAMRQVQAKGLRVQKRWICTHDAYTRDAHADLDGQIVDVDSPFDSLLGPIMYPGDPGADPKNVYNCRCALGYVYPDYDQGQGLPRTDGEADDNTAHNENYREWLARKAKEAG